MEGDRKSCHVSIPAGTGVGLPRDRAGLCIGGGETTVVGGSRGCGAFRSRAPCIHYAPMTMPLLLPLAARVGRLALRHRGVRARRVPTGLGSLHVYDARGPGDLPTTVLLHGLASAATPFGRLVEYLRPEVRRVVAPDYPGHGFSDEAGLRLTPEALCESIGGALDALVDEPAIVVGNSLGGAVALQYALARPTRVRALILVSPAGAPSSDEEWREIRSTFDVDSSAQADAFLRRLYHRPPWFLPLLARELPAVLQRRAVRDLLDTVRRDHALAPDSLNSLEMPVLLLWGQSDRLLPEAHFDYFARHLPSHAVVERPAGFGHCPHVDAPEALARRIISFVREALPPSRPRTEARRTEPSERPDPSSAAMGRSTGSVAGAARAGRRRRSSTPKRTTRW